MASILKPKRRSADGTAPTTTDLADGEVAINAVTKTIYQRIGAAVVAVANYFTDAPSDGTTYGRKDGAWVAAGGGASDPPTFTAKDANYTFVAGDAGLGYATTTSTARTYTIPASVFSAGDKIWVAAQSTGQITLARGSGLTLRLGGSTNNTNRLVGAYGMACIYFLSPTVAVVYGSGVG